jgi:hypothetical protein
MSSHFSKDTMQRFLRAELSRRENQSIVRHLLRCCPVCAGTAREADQRAGLKLTAVPRGEPARLVLELG